jgi:hypothetical protein
VTEPTDEVLRFLFQPDVPGPLVDKLREVWHAAQSAKKLEAILERVHPDGSIVPSFRAVPAGPPPEGARTFIDWHPVADHAIAMPDAWIKVDGMAKHVGNVTRGERVGARGGAFRPRPGGRWVSRTAGADLWLKWSTSRS